MDYVILDKHKTMIDYGFGRSEKDLNRKLDQLKKNGNDKMLVFTGDKLNFFNVGKDSGTPPEVKYTN